ncbi:MAG: hypothetical protein HOW73_45780 [Polyangiaceae bacterium]|nr:hypothetical protein [Polyangiaceae bacterium]
MRPVGWLALLAVVSCSPSSSTRDASDAPPTDDTAAATASPQPTDVAPIDTGAPSTPTASAPSASAGAPGSDPCGGCPTGQRCEECPPNACQKAAKPGVMCPMVCGAPACVPN